MGNAAEQGNLWGARAEDYAATIERAFAPLYEAALDRVGLRAGSAVLDVGCGPGLALQIAARSGVAVAGLDAAESSLAIARRRNPAGEFRTGDMEDLPWPDGTFDVVTGFNAFQFAADRVKALMEARRVTRSGGKVVMALWGPDEDCESIATIGALRQLLPNPPPPATGPGLSARGQAEALLDRAGLRPVESEIVDCPFDFGDLDTSIRAYLSAGVVQAIAHQVGLRPVQDSLCASLLQHYRSRGSFLQRNRFRYLIAAA